jgi:hypothetical protein
MGLNGLRRTKMPGLPNTFDPIRNDPDWKGFSPEEQAEFREGWVRKRMIASGNPRDEKLFQQLIKEAYSDLPQPPAEEGAFFPPWPEFKERMGTSWERGWGVPKEILWGGIKEVGTGEGTIPQRLSRMPAQIRDYFIGRRKATELPEEIEKVPGSSLWSDPFLWGLGKVGYKLGEKTVKGIGRIGERIRPPGIAKAGEETAEAFNARVMGEEAAKREALKGRIRELRGGREPISAPMPKTPTPTPRGPYNKAMVRLIPNYAKEEAKVVSEFVARHPDDILSKAILTEKPPLSPSTLSEIERRIFNRVPQPPVTPPPPPGPRIPPPVGVESAGVAGGINLNDPKALAEWMLKQGGGI